jgi:hypothetical protein
VLDVQLLILGSRGPHIPGTFWSSVFVIAVSWKPIFLIFQSEKDYDPFAERRRPTVAEKEDEYRQKRRMMIISPERVDPFAEGLSTS